MYVIDDPAQSMQSAKASGVICANDPASYRAAAAQINNESGIDAVWIQHEFGIFGGESGEMICDFAEQIAAPLVFTFHTVLAEPSDVQRRIMLNLIARATRIMVMSKHSREILSRVYGGPSTAIDVIEHGAPDRPFGRQAPFKQRFGLEGRMVLMTFGLLGPGKGLEHAIEALPGIVRGHPDVIYRVAGAHRRPSEHDEIWRLVVPVSGRHSLPGECNGANHPGVVSERRALDQCFDIRVGKFKIAIQQLRKCSADFRH